ncbi:MAG: rod shape-determining protein MreC [Curvibacter sp.]|nr:rod shape-determining protein MreC [Burkholderiaceae bacterium]MBV8618006.1 rod shape-determining protein MreC [Curvibacter sp.]
MPLGTLDRNPPPFFKQGPSALSRLLFFSALSLFLMVADVRFQITQPVRAVVSTVLYPMQWLALQPVRWIQGGSGYFESLQQAQVVEEDARRKLALLSQRASQVEELLHENARLRGLLTLNQRLQAQGQAAEVLYDAPDPYTRRVVIDKGQLKNVQLGAPVIDEAGVLGQVTRVEPLMAEVTLVIDRDFAIPVLNTRTGARSVAYGDSLGSGGLELRFMPANADVQDGDLLSTSGVDGVYPPGLQVARVDKVERRADSAFARIHCLPLALVSATRHVMVLSPVGSQMPPRPQPVEVPAAGSRKGARK